MIRPIREAPGARLGYRVNEDIAVEAGFFGYDSAIRFDNPYSYAAIDVYDPRTISMRLSRKAMRASSRHARSRLDNRFTLLAM